MKHVRHISSRKPAKANLFQDVACATNDILLALKQADIPAKNLVADQCFIPSPNDPENIS